MHRHMAALMAAFGALLAPDVERAAKASHRYRHRTGAGCNDDFQHAEAANARLLAVFPKGYALDATHRPHITMLQRYVRTTDFDRVYAAVGAVPADEKPRGAAW